MKSERELFKLATDMVFVENRLNQNAYGLEREELLEEEKRIRKVLFQKNYDVNMFLHYKELYKNMSVAEYYKFIDTLE